MRRPHHDHSLDAPRRRRERGERAAGDWPRVGVPRVRGDDRLGGPHDGNARLSHAASHQSSKLERVERVEGPRDRSRADFTHRRVAPGWLGPWSALDEARTDPRRGRPRRRRGVYQVLESPRRRPRGVHAVPPRVPPERRAARPVLRPRPLERRDRAHHVRALERILRRSHREEAAQSFPAGHAGSVVRDGRLQPHLQVLPELGYLQVARHRHAGRCGFAGGRRRCGGASRLPERRLHVQRSGHLPRVRHRRGEGMPRSGA